MVADYQNTNIILYVMKIHAIQMSCICITKLPERYTTHLDDISI